MMEKILMLYHAEPVEFIACVVVAVLCGGLMAGFVAALAPRGAICGDARQYDHEPGGFRFCGALGGSLERVAVRSGCAGADKNGILGGKAYDES